MDRPRNFVASLVYFLKNARFVLKCLFWFYGQRLVRICLDNGSQTIAGYVFPAKRDKLPPIKEPLLLEAASVLAEKIRKGELKSEVLLKAYIKRAQAVNPFVNGYICSRFKEALEEAKEIDSRVQEELSTQQAVEGEPSIHSQPLLGIPFSVKDSVAVQDMLQTSGILSRKGFRSRNDSKVVQNLRQAGAIPIAVTNVKQICCATFFN